MFRIETNMFKKVYWVCRYFDIIVFGKIVKTFVWNVVPEDESIPVLDLTK